MGVAALVAVALPSAAVAQVPLPQLPVPLPPTQQPPQERPPPSPPPPPPPPASSGDASVTARIDPAQTGFAPTEDLFPPLTLRWSHKLEGMVGTPLIADGRVFAATERDTGRQLIHAFDLATGETLWTQPMGGSLSWLAYADGRVFAPGIDSTVAYDAANGGKLWTANLGDDPDTNAVVAVGGVLYVPARGVAALDAATGQVRWRVGEYSTGLAYSDGRLIVSHSCHEVYALRSDNGQQLWREDGDDCGYGFSIPSVHDGRVYRSGVARIRAAADGKPVGDGFPFSTAAGFRDDSAYVATRDGVQAIPATAGSPRWSYGTRKEWGAPEGERRRSSPVVTPHNVFVLSPLGRLVVLDRQTGALRDGGTLKGLSELDRSLGEEWKTGLAAAQGSIAVPVRDWLHVLGSALAPPPDGADIGVYDPYPVFGRRVKLAAAAGRNLRGSRPELLLQHDAYPYGRWRDGARVQARPDGVAEYRFAPTRNTRFRARTPSGAVSRETTAFVYPAVNFRFAAAGPRHARVSFSVRGPRDIRLGGRRIFLYLNRAKSTRLTRLASATLRATGRGRARAVGTFRRLNRLGRKDFFYYCIRDIERQGFGERDRFARTCGARSTRF
jgi:outer membrane protein assembly factor BamB